MPFDWHKFGHYSKIWDPQTKWLIQQLLLLPSSNAYFLLKKVLMHILFTCGYCGYAFKLSVCLPIFVFTRTLFASSLLHTANSISLTHKISTSQPAPTSQQYFSLVKSQHQPAEHSQNRLLEKSSILFISISYTLLRHDYLLSATMYLSSYLSWNKIWYHIYLGKALLCTFKEWLLLL